MNFYGLEKPEASDYLQLARTSAELEKKAAEKGCVVRYPKPNELFIDIDSLAAEDAFRCAWEIFSKHEVGATYYLRESRSLGHSHVIVTLSRPVADKRERILLQAILGSDPSRETLSYIEYLAGGEHPTVFFEKE